MIAGTGPTSLGWQRKVREALKCSRRQANVKNAMQVLYEAYPARTSRRFTDREQSDHYTLAGCPTRKHCSHHCGLSVASALRALWHYGPAGRAFGLRLRIGINVCRRLRRNAGWSSKVDSTCGWSALWGDDQPSAGVECNPEADDRDKSSHTITEHGPVQSTPSSSRR